MRSPNCLPAAVIFCAALFTSPTLWAGQPNPKPTVTQVSPNTGPIAGATAVTLTGTNFIAGATVDFGGAAATNVVIASATSITCDTPAHAAGAVTVSVTTADGTGSLASGFTYTGGGGGGGGATGFRFLTTVLPDVSTNAVYSATLLTANASGSVTYSITASNEPTANGLFTGMIFDGATGFITGRPENVGGESPTAQVTFQAVDSAGNTIITTLNIKRSSTGGGGNAGIGFPISLALPDGTVGASYSKDIACEFGVGPFIFSALDLPPGITMSGLADQDRNFTLTGTPSAAGTYYVTFSVTDVGEGNNKVITILPLKVLPVGSQFQFTTIVLDNGEVGTAYEHTIATSGAAAAVTFGAVGLPAGLAIDPATGTISGTPTAGGTFYVNITATDGTSTITMNRSVIIAPSATSSFHWIFSGLPTGTLNVDYSRQPPIIVVTEAPGIGGGASIAVSGLPTGMVFSSGEISGTPSEVGIFPVTFTATDSASGAIITLSYDMVVFPPKGGDINSLPINLWVKKLQLKKTGTALKDSWQAQYIYNADRRLTLSPVRVYDAGTDPLTFALGSIPEYSIPRAKLVGSRPKFSFKSDKGALPVVAAKLDESGQTIAYAAKSITVTDTLPGVLRNTVRVGNKGYRLDLFMDEKGKFTATSGYRKTAFVVASAKATAKAAGKDSAAFSMYLADPAFVFPSATGNKTVTFSVINSANKEFITKDFTSIVTFTTATDKVSGLKTYKFKSGKDTANPIGKFTYDSKSGKLAVAFKGLTLTGNLAATEDHVSVIVTIADKQYFTAVTLFAPKAGSYSTKMPTK